CHAGRGQHAEQETCDAGAEGHQAKARVLATVTATWAAMAMKRPTVTRVEEAVIIWGSLGWVASLRWSHSRHAVPGRPRESDEMEESRGGMPRGLAERQPVLPDEALPKGAGGRPGLPPLGRRPLHEHRGARVELDHDRRPQVGSGADIGLAAGGQGAGPPPAFTRGRGPVT